LNNNNQRYERREPSLKRKNEEAKKTEPQPQTETQQSQNVTRQQNRKRREPSIQRKDAEPITIANKRPRIEDQPKKLYNSTIQRPK
jgi:hypothetical protein